MDYTRYTPRITLLQISLLRDLDMYLIGPDDDAHVVRKKQQKRLELIRGYCKELKRKRFAKAFHRFTKVRAKKQSLGIEAIELLEREMLDKNLMRYDYYDQNEPSEFVSFSDLWKLCLLFCILITYLLYTSSYPQIEIYSSGSP